VQSPAQNYARIDSLKKLWRVSGGEARYGIMNQIGFEYRISNPDSTIWFCTQAFDYGKELNLQSGLAESLGFIGLAYTYQGKPKEAHEYFTRAITLATEQADSLQLAHNTNNIGRLYFDQGDLSRAYKTFLQAQAIFETLGDKSGMAYVYKSLSAVYKSQHDYEMALEAGRKAYYLRDEIKDTRGMLSSLSDLAMIHFQIHEADKAVECLGKADRLAIKTDDQISRAELKLNVSEILLKEQKPEEAEKEIRQAMQIISRTQNLSFLPRADLLMASYHVTAREPAKATTLLHRIVANNHNPLSILREANRLLAEAYSMLGNSALAAGFHNSFLIQSEQLENADLTREIGQLKFQLAIEKKEKENELLMVAQARNQETINRQQMLNSGLIALATLFMILAGVLWSNARKRRKLYEKLTTQKEQIEKQQAEILRQNQNLSRQNSELARINAEKDTLMNIVAHDLKSPLARISGIANLLNLEGGLGKNQQQYLSMLQEVSRSGEEMITDLLDLNSFAVARSNPVQPAELKKLLESRLEAIEHEADRKRIRLILNVESDGLLECDVHSLTRIIDNLISNAVKFSRFDSQVIVSGSVGGGVARISVKDEGPGFTEEDKTHLFQKFRKLSARPTGGESSNGLGLAIVKFLTERLGATIQLETQAGQGSEFVLLCPVHQPVPRLVKP
jgi:signal transduction histidine kinase